MSSKAAEALGTAEIVNLVFSFLDLESAVESWILSTRLSLPPTGSSVRLVNHLWKREADRLIGLQLARYPRRWDQATEWPVRERLYKENE